MANMATDVASNESKRTAYLGPEASFSHQAVVEALPYTTPCPLPSFGAILKTLQEDGSSTEGGLDYAVLPVENSTNGSVVQALDLLAKCGLDPETSIFSDVEVVDEHYLEVHHCLFVSRKWAEKYLDTETVNQLQQNNERQELTTNGTEEAGSGAGPWSPKLEEILAKLNIKTIYSHPQVWGQCNQILSALLPAGHVDRVDMSSTSAAASFVANSANLSDANGIPITTTSEQNGRKGSMVVETGGIAAISSSLAGEKHHKDLICIARNIEDDPGSNTTRFFILQNRNRKTTTKPPMGQSLPSSVSVKSLLAFTTIHDVPGSLAQALAVFAQCGFNLTAIQSRPRPKARKRASHDTNPETNDSIKKQQQRHRPQDSNWKYVFFVECLHVRTSQDSTEADEKVETLLRELTTATERLVSLGSWQDRLSM